MWVVSKQVVLGGVQHLLVAHCKAEVPAPQGHDAVGHEGLPHHRLWEGGGLRGDKGRQVSVDSLLGRGERAGTTSQLR